MYAHRYGIDEALTNTEFYLDRMKAEIEKNLEKYINNQYKQITHLLSQTKEHYKQVSSGEIKTSCPNKRWYRHGKEWNEKKGTSMTDGSPLKNDQEITHQKLNQHLRISENRSTNEQIKQ